MSIIGKVFSGVKSIATLPLAATGSALGAVGGALGMTRGRSLPAPSRMVSGGVATNARRATTLSSPTPLPRAAQPNEMASKWAETAERAAAAVAQKIQPRVTYELANEQLNAAEQLRSTQNWGPQDYSAWLERKAFTDANIAQRVVELEAHVIAEASRSAVNGRVPFDLVGNVKADLAKVGMAPSGSVATDLSRNVFFMGDSSFKPFEGLIAPAAMARSLRAVAPQAEDAAWTDHLWGAHRELRHIETLDRYDVIIPDGVSTFFLDIPEHATHFVVPTLLAGTSPVAYRHVRYSRVECGLAATGAIKVTVKIAEGSVTDPGLLTIGTKAIPTYRTEGSIVPLEIISDTQFAFTPDLKYTAGLAAGVIAFGQKSPWGAAIGAVAPQIVEKLTGWGRVAPTFRAAPTGVVTFSR